ncbi:MAG: hypothetical protein QME51_06280, partial [Planctomycetota bacterium]|nr:hypothetical protein [Planctomycetota bacterium]
GKGAAICMSEKEIIDKEIFGEIEKHNDNVPHIQDMMKTLGWQILEGFIKELIEDNKDIRKSTIETFVEKQGFIKGLQSVLDVANELATEQKTKEEPQDNP